MLDGVKVQDWKQVDRQANRTLAFNLYNGRVCIQVFDNNNMRNKLFRKSLNEEELVMVSKIIDKVMAGSPETKCSVQFQQYDRNSKQFRIESVYSMEKDSKQMYKISVTDCIKQQTCTFTLKARATMTTGSEPLNDANLSSLKIETLKDWITGAKIWGPATIVPINRGQGGGYNGGGGGAAAPSAPAADDESLPF